MTDDVDPGEFDRELEGADSTAILLQILAQLDYQNQLLEQAVTEDAQGGESGQPTQWACGMCSWTGVEGERREHAMREHNLPPGMSLDGQFSRVG